MCSLRSSIIIGAVLSLLSIFAAPGLVAEQIETKPITFDVTVAERNGRSVRDLAKEEFAIHEDGVKQKIESFDSKDAPFSLGLVIDASGSLREKLVAVQKAAFQAITRLSQEDEAFLAQFKAESELLEDFTNDRQKLAQALRQIRPSGGTSLLDAIIATAEYAEEKGKYRRKALLIITDGIEKNSASKEKQVASVLMENRVQLYFICLPADQQSSLFGNSSAARGKELVTRLAELSGGRAFFLNQISEASAVAEGIIETVRQQYQISYLPANQKQDGEWRKVKVEVSPKTDRKLTVITQPGYFAPGHITEKEKARQKEAEKKQNKKP